MLQRKNIDMTKGNVIARVFTFSLPLLLANLFQQFYSLVDATIVGKYIGISALAAVGGSGWIQWLLLGLSRDLANAFSIIASKRIGAKSKDGYRDVVCFSFILGTVIAVLLTALPILFIDPILLALHIPLESYYDARIYLLIFTANTPFVLLFNIMSALLQAKGKSGAQSIAMICSTFSNIILDITFVIVFEWGVAGVAVATLLSQILANLIVARQFLRENILENTKGRWQFYSYLLAEVSNLSLPMFFNSMIIACGGLIVQTQVNRQGAAFAAGVSAGTKIFSLLEAIIMAIQVGTTIFIGQNIGAKQYQRIKRGVFQVVLVAESITVLLALFTFFLSPYVLPFMMKNSASNLFQEAFQTGLLQIRILSVSMLIMTPMYLYRGAIHTLGYAIYPFLAGCAQLIVRIMTVLFLPQYIGQIAFLFPTVGAWTVSLPIVFFSYRYYLHRMLDGTQKEKDHSYV